MKRDHTREGLDMAKTKSKSKSKFDFKQFLLKRGEYLAMETAGFFLFLLMLWGVTKWSSTRTRTISPRT